MWCNSKQNVCQQLGSTAVVSLMNSVLVLYQTVLLPLCCGQLSRRYGLAGLVYKLPLSTVGEVALLFIIFTTFCDALKTHDVGMNALDILITVGLGKCLFLFTLSVFHVLFSILCVIRRMLSVSQLHTFLSNLFTNTDQ